MSIWVPVLLKTGGVLDCETLCNFDRTVRSCLYALYQRTCEILLFFFKNLTWVTNH